MIQIIAKYLCLSPSFIVLKCYIQSMYWTKMCYITQRASGHFSLGISGTPMYSSTSVHTDDDTACQVVVPSTCRNIKVVLQHYFKGGGKNKRNR